MDARSGDVGAQDVTRQTQKISVGSLDALLSCLIMYYALRDCSATQNEFQEDSLKAAVRIPSSDLRLGGTFTLREGFIYC